MASAPREVWGDLATTAFVEASHLFKTLDPDARRDLIQLARVVAFAPDEVVSGEADEGFYLVVDGAASARVSAAGGTVEIARLERGAFFGEARVLGTGRRSSLVALGDVTLVAFAAPVVSALSARFPKMKKLLEVVLAARERTAAQAAAS